VHALSGLKVIDASTLFAGPVIATLLGDFGAEVLKVEHPGGDALRTLGWEKDGISLWWLFVNRNKRCVTLDLGEPQGQELLRELVAGADVLVENFRPGRMEGWGLGWDALSSINPGLVMVRVSAGAGAGQMIDLSIYEPLFWILGAQVTVYDQLGVIQERMGNRAPFTAPRNAFQADDGRWFGLSASSQSIAERLARLVGRGDLVEEDWFRSHHGRLEHQDEIEDAIAAWIGARPSQEVIAAFEAFEAAIAPIYSMADIMADPQYQARETIATASHPVLGPVKVPGVVPRLSATPGEIRHLGRALGEDNEAVYVDGLGHQPADLAAWKAAGII